MEQFIQLTINGLADGAILTLAALGFVLIYKASGVINFAQGFFLAVGAYVLWTGMVELGLTALALLAFGLFFTRSRHGVAMRAVADDQQAAMVMGISVRRTFALAWALAGVSAVVGGMLVANLTRVSQNVAGFGLLVFPVVILGGLDSIPGAVVGGAVIGLLTEYTGGYVGGGLQTVIPYVALVLVLLVKPYGLFGQVRIERV